MHLKKKKKKKSIQKKQWSRATGSMEGLWRSGEGHKASREAKRGAEKKKRENGAFPVCGGNIGH